MNTKLSPESRCAPSGVALSTDPLVRGASNRAAPAFRQFILFFILLSTAFGKPLFDLLRLALHDSLASHLPLIPFITGYLLWIRRHSLNTTLGGNRWPSILFALAAIASLALALTGSTISKPGQLSLFILSYCLLIWGGGCFWLGSAFMRAVAFPSIFLIFMVPLPPDWVSALESFLQHGSAEVAYWMLQLVGMPMLRDGDVFQMPGLTIEVAPECSGIRSSLVLFLTALLAGYLFLRSSWRRGLFALLVIPLGLLRNGFRILVLSLLCVHVDPAYIHSPIHHSGGPIFFVLSLVPFSLVLLWLWKTEQRPRLSNPSSS